jgi:hypothetical protein
MIDYRHFIAALKRKSQAFKDLAFRNCVFPREAYLCTLEVLDQGQSARQACRTMVGLLELAAMHGVEGLLAQRLEGLLAAGQLPDLNAVQEEFAPRTSAPRRCCTR